MNKILEGSPLTTKVNTISRNSLIRFLMRLVREKPLGTFGAIIVLAMLLVGTFANFIAPYGYNDVDLSVRLTPPSPEYLLGTDNIGRDLLSRIIYGARISMFVGLGGAGLSVTIAIIIGLVTGYLGGKIDIVTQRFVDGVMCFPPLFLYLTVMAVLGPGILQVILVLGVLSGIRDSRVVRSAVLSVKQNTYVDAARAIGAPTTEILYRHILPNVFPSVIILFTLLIGSMIIAEATLSFLGLGIPPPQPSWGGMLSESGRTYMLIGPWMALWPGVALALVVYGVNMLGDAIRDILDPRLKGGLGRYNTKKRKKKI